MNLSKLKNYAPQARQAFMQAMTDRAAFYGVTATKIEPVVEKGDVALIAGREHPRAVAQQRAELEKLVQREGFAQAMDVMAYTWFNRLVAIRFMELHGYLDHGYRVLSHPEGKAVPEILEHAEHLDLPGLDKARVIELKLDGGKDAQLYHLLVVAQCNALHEALPFLFARIDDESALLLPENLLHSDSLTRKLVSEIPDEDWNNVEILGWLYQFYISERKDQVMARKSAVPTEDIPAVTQLFTPHWIVRYLVENSLGRLWLLNRPASKLREQMPYYIEGEAETDFLKINKPEEIRLLDPAVGSGHMLTYAFDLLYLIYQEEGYVPAEIPALILGHNLYGLEICPRAAQLAQLALVFKAREKSRRFFQRGNLVQPHILALQNIRFGEGELSAYFQSIGTQAAAIDPQLPELLRQFEAATTFGSLIQPCMTEPQITAARTAIQSPGSATQLLLHETHRKVLRALDQAEMLCQRYQVVVANPPYMGAGTMNTPLKQYVADRFPFGKLDLYGAFMARNAKLSMNHGFIGMITIPNWLSLEAFSELRTNILTNSNIRSLIHNGRGVWGGDFGSCAFIIANGHSGNDIGTYRRLFRKIGEIQSNDELVANFFNYQKYPIYRASSSDFSAIPGNIIAYWVSSCLRSKFAVSDPLGDLIPIKSGMSTTDNNRFLRRWFEVAQGDTKLDAKSHLAATQSRKKWFPYKKGGNFRKWHGNDEYVLNWMNDGEEIKQAVVSNLADPKTKHWSRRIFGTEYFFLPSVSWSRISISQFSVRVSEGGSIFSDASNGAFPDRNINFFAAFLNSKLVSVYLEVLSPTINFYSGDIAKLPMLKSFAPGFVDATQMLAEQCVRVARHDWDNFETSWDFRDLPLLRPGTKGETLAASWEAWRDQCSSAIRRMQELETENNRLFIEAYGLQDELTPEVPEEQITLARADARGDVAAFLSYAVGCMMGRYSLDKPGLVLADAGDSLAEYLAKVGRSLDALTFEPDADGIIPVLDDEWFEDDIVARTRAFLRVTFGAATLEENLRFIEASLGKELRKYFLADFYKDHLQTYKKRPIYWLFSSGKQRAFQCLVYLHRYNDGTLSRMRTEYVIPLQSRIAARIEQLEDDKLKATSTSHGKKLQKEQDDLKKQQTELLAFDERLKHAADKRIVLDLDDGVKVNYGKFGDLLADVKSVTGGSEE